MFDGLTGLELVTDPSHVGWLGRRLQPWGKGQAVVGQFVPDGFERCVRILHPALGPDGLPRSWRAVAAWSGRRLTATSFFNDIAVREDGLRWSSVDGGAPREGSLDEQTCALLATVLSQFTSTPDRAWFCVWSGLGFAMDSEDPRLVDITPQITGSGRRYLLYRGASSAVVNFRFEPVPWLQSPAYWWPEDRAWCVCTEVDAQSTYVGGSGALIDRLLATDRLEAFPAALDDPWDGTHPGQATDW